MNDIKSFNHYFYFDLPIPFQLRNNVTIEIKPVSLLDSELFLNSVDILRIDKNSLPSVEIIQMSYLEFLMRIVFPNDLSLLSSLARLLEIIISDYLYNERHLEEGTMTKMRRNEEVALSVLLRICEYLDCNIGDICDAVKIEKE